MELDFIAGRAERDAIERIVESRHCRRRERDGNRLQRQLQREEQRAERILPERHPVRIEFEPVAEPECKRHSNAQADCYADSETDRDANSRSDRHGDSKAQCDADSGRGLSRDLCGQQRLEDRLHRGAIDQQLEQHSGQRMAAHVDVAG